MGSLPATRPDRTLIGGSLEISRMVNGLWQLAGGHDKDVNIAAAANVMNEMALRGLDTFDMADHYGDAELVVGHHNATSTAKTVAFTKWCPQENGVKTFENAEAAINLALKRMGQTKIDLLQYHAWDYCDDTYLHNMHHLVTLQKQGKIGLIGLTNTDAAHLELLLESGFPIATNQVSTSVIDRRLTRGRLNDVCINHGVGILAYGTLLGGFLSEKWLGQPEPANIEDVNWSLRKYLRFIWAAGGWGPFQRVLEALNIVAQRHRVSIVAVATRFVLDIPSVKAVIVGTRLSANSTGYIASNLQAFGLQMTSEDTALIRKAQEGLQDVPGDCGDEYRRPPYLTAAGDLSHHVEETDRKKLVQEAISSGKRLKYSTGSLWEPIAGYCRAVRTGNTIRVSGTTSNSAVPSIPAIGGSSARSQTVHILDIIEGSLKALGSSLSDVVRTRIMVRDVSICGEVSRAHGWVFQMPVPFPQTLLRQLVWLKAKRWSKLKPKLKLAALRRAL
ncbi:NADP-dependent oxidoreductase domain-containing protein [Dactylonectria macrodidyma]|uniref:NADP-dependent oxidoreductase domain-containing protein n=1 Tax=Dactylonectria macrodidyma TaxID=307937 RepID=A0A9P9E2H6_9HYPO|nr:NADP-dependent oxidoreductase domain-containing protein [Dactylonectria macrodidyma]